jgi:hypothetical protein
MFRPIWPSSDVEVVVFQDFIIRCLTARCVKENLVNDIGYRFSYFRDCAAYGSDQIKSVNHVFSWRMSSSGMCRSWVNRRFGGTYRLHLQDRKISERGTRVSRWLKTEPQVGNNQLYKSREGDILHSHRCKNLKLYMCFLASGNDRLIYLLCQWTYSVSDFFTFRKPLKIYTKNP